METVGQTETRPPKPKNWLVESILVTILCCLPFGIVGIVNAASVDSRYNGGDYDGALNASKQAGTWTKLGFFIGLAIIALYIVAVVIMGVSMPGMMDNGGDF